MKLQSINTLFLQKLIEMVTAIKGKFENGKLTMIEQPPKVDKSDVLILFMNEEESIKTIGVKFGSLEGQINIPDDFNDPIDDLKDYMN